MERRSPARSSRAGSSCPRRSSPSSPRLFGLAFAGSPTQLAEGVTVAGVDVGGLTRTEARSLLEQRYDKVAHVPVVFTAGDESYPIKAVTLGVEADWNAALGAATREGEGFGPVRGFRRLHARFFGAEIAPPVQAYNAALDYKLGRLATAIDRNHLEAKLIRRGLQIEVVPEQSGRKLDRDRAASTIVRALAQLDRGTQIPLPVRVDPATVTAAELAPARRQAEIALSAPVRLEYDGTRWKLPRWRIADLLLLPSAGATKLAIAGPGAEAWFEKLRKRVEHAPRRRQLRGVPGRNSHCARRGRTRRERARDREGTAGGGDLAERADGHPGRRDDEAERYVADAQAMGITGVVASYHTTYGGIANRLHNVALVANLIDETLIAPGKTFSFNATTGERTPEKGFLEAPVIINGELQTGLGGGVCQVSTTVFNAAYEAGSRSTSARTTPSTSRHYPLGRDATVNYPDQDLKFTNDTGKWLLLRTFVGAGSLTVNLYGTPQNRQVESVAQPLRVIGQPQLKRIPDPTMLKGESSWRSYGEPARSTSVTRIVRSPSGEVLHENTWYSTYRSEPKVVRVGTKPKPEPEPKPKPPSHRDDDDPAADAAAAAPGEPPPTPQP